MAQQPWLHELEIAVDGPSTLLSDRAGVVRAPGTGWFLDDQRVLSLLELRVAGEGPVPVAASSAGARTELLGVARALAGPTPDPLVQVHRRRLLRDAELVEEIEFVSRAEDELHLDVELDCGGDGAALARVKGGLADDDRLLVAEPDGPGASWADERHRTTLSAQPTPTAVEPVDGGGVRLRWGLSLPAQGRTTLRVLLAAERLARTTFDSRPGRCDLSAVRLDAGPRWELATGTNLADLRHLAQIDPEHPEDSFIAAGSPWYLTLFGRDAVWAARLLLPFAPDLALGTARTLARRQAVEHDASTGAEPGKILHEVRRESFQDHELDLPPVYFGSVDATALWVCLVHDLWRWGTPPEDLAPLVPHVRAALGWMQHAVAASPDGFLRYLDAAGTGLANQGWKDSGDSMRRADGSIAPAPIALLEAQGYAVEAARGAADLLEALDAGDGQPLRDWADALSGRVRERFWVGSGDEAYLAMALDRDGAPVDGVGSNMGHVLETGMLTPQEADRVVRRLLRPDLLTSFGIATLSSDNPAYNPLGYHTGSVWTHDTAIALRGLVATGHREAADQVVEGLLRLAEATGGRFPELLSGEAVGRAAAPYPAACRPQAWSAATAAAMMTAAVGLGVDGPASAPRLRTDPSPALPTGWALHGVVLAGERRTVTAPG
ncbi:amylo-alpha-1,6-glucosidase [Serinicoccus hydrothermalis]|uniref:Amylo-alpha-1,6-glucosidase n=1 Tax=Serinicoccus hydrothermalis TaxID=1758689 RepID=A0A1B1NCM8_9MICO|nr:glycogen debranching N-terminal domain-containing protein [Serinicoccus hydrothermalis]ANS79125.1 amylo-alpha-1,6-glucosidase [Serinicoccus hydrothermalis]